METKLRSGSQYVLGSNAEELARLDSQAAVIERPTRMILQAAGLAMGMRVLDLGCDLGHVSARAAQAVGPTGSVLGLDQSPDALAVARDRAERAGATNLHFIEGDATAWRTSEPFDAILGRLLLFHLTDPAAVVRHHLSNLRPGGMFVAIDFDLGGSRTEPLVALADEVLRWVEQAFRAAGASPRIGARLGVLLGKAGCEGVTTFGIQAYLAPLDRSGPALLAGVARSLATAIIRHGIATAEQLDAPTLEQRIAQAVQQTHAVLLPPTVVGAWGYSPTL